MNNQKKLIAAFRNFVDKIFLPSLKKTDPQALEWSKFNAYLNSPIINYEQLFQYVESINNNSSNLNSSSAFERRQIPPFKKPKLQPQGSNGESGGFNPSKTFGGERARMMILKGQDEFGDRKENPNGFGFGNRFEDRGNRNFGGGNAQNVLPGLQNLCKTFLQNQQRIQGLLSNGYVVTSPNSKYS